MTITPKAVAAALLIALAPAAVSAQGFTNFGPGVGGAPAIGAPITGTPVQGIDCGASYLQSVIGLNANHLPLPPGVRVIGPDTIVTFDYRPDRLNVATTHNGTITRVYCG